MTRDTRKTQPYGVRAVLPRALIRPNAAFAATPWAGTSLTLAVLRAFELDEDLRGTVVDDISNDRSFFHGVPGVMR